MATARETMLLNSWDNFKKKKLISIEDADDLMCQVEKVLQNIQSAEESRDSWRERYKLRNNDAKDYAKEITRLQKELKDAS